MNYVALAKHKITCNVKLLQIVHILFSDGYQWLNRSIDGYFEGYFLGRVLSFHTPEQQVAIKPCDAK